MLIQCSFSPEQQKHRDKNCRSFIAASTTAEAYFSVLLTSLPLKSFSLQRLFIVKDIISLPDLISYTALKKC